MKATFIKPLRFPPPYDVPAVQRAQHGTRTRATSTDAAPETRGRPTAYPWAKWLGAPSRVFVLVKGIDFPQDPRKFAQQIRSRAVLQRLKVSLRFVGDDTIVGTVRKSRVRGK